MKLRDKKTGEIVKVNNFNGFIHLDDETQIYHSLAELNEEWEDYEEQKEYWYLENNGDIDKETYEGDSYEERMIEIGNYFETKEEAERAVERLRAWKRLKDNGFKFVGRNKHNYGEEFIIKCHLPADTLVIDVASDLQLLFGGYYE